MGCEWRPLAASGGYREDVQWMYVCTRTALVMWAQAIWDQHPAPRIMQVVLGQATKELQAADNPRRPVTTPHDPGFETLRRLGWILRSATTTSTDTGETIDMTAPRQVQQLVELAAVRASGPGRGTLPTDPRPHMWRSLERAFDIYDFGITEVRAHTSVADVHASRFSHWERKGNMAADTYAMRSAERCGTAVAASTWSCARGWWLWRSRRRDGRESMKHGWPTAVSRAT
ncbi:unnamed protein product, partial [Prorocentrum cordatum]